MKKIVVTLIFSLAVLPLFAQASEEKQMFEKAQAQVKLQFRASTSAKRAIESAAAAAAAAEAAAAESAE